MVRFREYVSTSNDLSNLSEKQIKEKLEVWIKELRIARLDKKLQEAFENDKSHTKFLSKN